MIMRGEERACARVLLKMLDDGPRDGEAIDVAVPRPTSSRRTRLAGVA